MNTTTTTTTTQSDAARDAGQITPEIKAAFLRFKKWDRENIFADSIDDLCDAEKRRIHACSNDDASALCEVFEQPTPEKVFEFDAENQLELFSDGSLYEKSSADSQVFADGSCYMERLDMDEQPIGLQQFFGFEVEEASHFHITRRTHFYGPLKKEELVMDECWKVQDFDSKADAQKWISETESGEYRLEHNEASRPDFIITPAR